MGWRELALRPSFRVAKAAHNPLLLSGMPTVAEQLRLAREGQNLDVYQVADLTKIKTEHVRALESGDYQSFSAPVYIRGFVRTYAKAQKLDVPQVISDLDAELGQTEKFREPPPLTEPARGGVDFLMLQLTRLNWRAAVVIAGVVLLILLVWSGIRSAQHKTRGDPLRNLPPGLYQTRPDASGELLPLPTNSPPR